MSGLVNKVKDALHSDKSTTHSTTNTHTGTTGTTGTTGRTGGLHESSHASSGIHEPGLSHGTHEGGLASTTGNNRNNLQKTDGPHGNLGNKLDPRVDSDRDYSRNVGLNSQRNAETSNHQHGTLGSTGTTTTGHTTGHNTRAGPHSSNLANSADPRIDSDFDGSRNAGINPQRNAQTGHSTLGSSGTTGHTGAFDSSRTTGTTGTTGNTLGSSGHTTGHTGNTLGSSGLTGSGIPGPAPNTAGPHKSDMLNKADPRVDADLDGSKTYGGNKTFDRV